MNDRKLKLNYVSLEKRAEQYITEECFIEDTEVNESNCRWSDLSLVFLAMTSRSWRKEGASSEQKHFSLAWWMLHSFLMQIAELR